MKLFSICISLLFSTIMASAQSPWLFTGKYPATKTVTQEDDFFGTKVADPYRWLEDDRSPETKSWVEEQNSVTNEYLSHIPYRDIFKERLSQLWNYEKYTIPYKEGDYTYYSKNDGLQNQYVLYREKNGGQPEVFLDPNKFSKDGTTSLEGIDFTHDGSIAAYQISEGGSDWRKVIVINTKNKKEIGDTMRDIKFSGVAWRGNDGFYYSSYPRPKGSELTEKTEFHTLYYHELGTPQSKDVLIFGGPARPRRYITGSVTEDQKYLIISAANTTFGNELYVQDLTKDNAPIIAIVQGFDNEHDVVHAENGKLYIQTSRNAPNHKVVVTDAATPGVENWKDLIKEFQFPLTVTTAGHKLFAHYLINATSHVEQYNLDGHNEGEIPATGLGTVSGLSGKMDENVTYYVFTSYTSPAVIYQYDIKQHHNEIYKAPNFKADLSQYESKQVFYNSKDGTKIPMILTYKKGIKLDGSNPCMLYGYGGFNISLTPSFSVSNIVFLENGGIYAVANLRGGGEFGETWHQGGTKMNKQNVFIDFIEAAEYLIKEHYTSSNYLAISGGSNGGLLVGACMTMRPELFRVCLPAVGVLDMLRYNKFTAGAGWASDYGTAQDDRNMFNYLYSYSPLHNVKNGTCYPATLVTTGDHDDRVVPAHSFKFAATLQTDQGCLNPVLISIATKAGHGAGKPTSKVIQEQADKWAFLFWNMNIPHFSPKF